jgi:hypothetical protein
MLKEKQKKLEDYIMQLKNFLVLMMVFLEKQEDKQNILFQESMEELQTNN